MHEVVLTNISTREESEKMYKLFLKAIRKNNTHCVLATTIAISVAMIVMAIARVFLTGDTLLVVCAFSALAMLGVTYMSVHSMEYECPLNWPATYVYHKLLEEYQVVKSEVFQSDGLYDLCFTISDKDKVISQTWCNGFEKVIRGDISTWMVDLTNRKLLIPYAKVLPDDVK